MNCSLAPAHLPSDTLHELKDGLFAFLYFVWFFRVHERLVGVYVGQLVGQREDPAAFFQIVAFLSYLVH